ncbi:MAG: hypothetical protein ACC663_12310, partial [Gammaproteobacteria bacterium]
HFHQSLPREHRERFGYPWQSYRLGGRNAGWDGFQLMGWDDAEDYFGTMLLLMWLYSLKPCF